MIEQAILTERESKFVQYIRESDKSILWVDPPDLVSKEGR